MKEADIRWKLFHDWEREENRRRFRNLSIKQAFKIFDDLSIFLDTIPRNDIEKLRKKRLQFLIHFKKKLDATEK